MPAIVPNLLLIDADVAARERASSIMSQLPGRLLVAEDCESALQMASTHLIDLIVCDKNAILQGQRIDDTIARFHRLPGQHNIPVLFRCNSQRSGVSLKTHRWGVAYHVRKVVAPQVLLGLIRTSLSLKVRSISACHQREQTVDHPPAPNGVAKPLKPFGLTLPEVIMPPHEPSVSLRNVPLG